MTVEKRAADAVLRGLRVPLQGVSGLVQLLADSRLNAEQRQYVSLLRSTVLQIAVLVEDGIDLDSRPVAAKAAFRPAELVETIRNVFLAASNDRGLDLQISIEEETAETVHGDAVVFRQLVFAAMERAFAAANGKVEARAGWQSGRMWFSVYADGVGAVEDWVVRNPPAVASMCNGAEWTPTIYLSGLRIATSVPAEVVQVSPTPSANVVQMRSAIDRHRVSVPPARMLVIEDQSSTRTMIRAILERAGHTVSEASCAEAALELIEQERFELLIVDLHLPDMSGHVMMQHVQAMQIGYRTPALGISADDSMEALQSVQASGLLGLIPKPPTPERLLSAVAFALTPAAQVIAPIGGDPVIDPVAFSDLAGIGGAPFVEKLVRQSIEDAKSCLGAMREASATLDMVRWREHAHALRGVAMTVAAARLAAGAGDVIARSDADLVGKTTAFEARLAALLQEAETALARRPAVG